LDYTINYVTETVKELHFIFPAVVVAKIETTLLSDFMQLQLLMGDSTNSFTISLPEMPATATYTSWPTELIAPFHCTA
jgi:hypothetical protein